VSETNKSTDDDENDESNNQQNEDDGKYLSGNEKAQHLIAQGKIDIDLEADEQGFA
jgi:hypothetical protein